MWRVNNEFNELLLNPHHDKNDIKNYIIKFFRKHKAKKPDYFYKTVINFYNHYPDTCLDIISNIPKLGYWKDYFYILEVNNNDYLEEYIFNILITRLRKDIYFYKDNKRISYLAKWMPREYSHFDKTLNFLNKFCFRFYPKDEKKTARRKYRKTITTLSRCLDVTEIKLCAKENNKINFKHVGPLCLKNNYKRFMRNKDTRNKFENYLYDKYCKTNITNFFKIFLLKDLGKFKQNILNRVWINRRDKFLKKIWSENTKNIIPVLDIDNNIIKSDLLYYVIGVSILLSEESNNKIIINSYEPTVLELENSIYDKAKTIMENLISYNKFDLNKIINLCDNVTPVILTKKDYKDIDKNHSVIYWLLNDNNKIIKTKKINNTKLIEGISFKPIDKTYKTKNEVVITNILNNTKEFGPIDKLKLIIGFLIFIILLFIVL